jgi:hypothetical protein
MGAMVLSNHRPFSVEMDIADAQRQIRTGFSGGFHGQAVSGVLWLASASLAACLLGGGVPIAISGAAPMSVEVRRRRNR